MGLTFKHGLLCPHLKKCRQLLLRSVLSSEYLLRISFINFSLDRPLILRRCPFMYRFLPRSTQSRSFLTHRIKYLGSLKNLLLVYIYKLVNRILSSRVCVRPQLRYEVPSKYIFLLYPM